MHYSIKRTLLASIITLPILTLPTVTFADSAMHVVSQTQLLTAERKNFQFELKTLSESYSANFRGNIEFNKDFTAVISMGESAYLYLETRSGFKDRSLEMITDNNGSPDHIYKVDGKRQPFDVNAKDWFSTQLEKLNPKIGIKAFTRVKSLMANGGFETVISEIDRLTQIESNVNFGYISRTGNAEAAYVEALINNYPLSPMQVIKTLSTIVDNLSSQSSSDMIMSFANYFPKSKIVTNALVKSSGQISSSSTSAETLLALKDIRDISKETRAIYLTAIENISSGKTQKNILLQSKKYCHTDDILLKQCLSIAKEFSSSNAQEFLSELIKTPDISTKNITRLIEAAQEISSSSAQGQYLQALVASNPLDDSNVRTFLRSADEIGSSSIHADTLITLIDNQELSQASWINLLAATNGVSSSSAAASILNRISKKIPVNKKHDKAIY